MLGDGHRRDPGAARLHNKETGGVDGNRHGRSHHGGSSSSHCAKEPAKPEPAEVAAAVARSAAVASSAGGTETVHEAGANQESFAFRGFHGEAAATPGHHINAQMSV